MTDDILPEKNASNQSGGWWRRYVAALGRGLTPEVAAEASRRSGRTFLQAALPVVVAAGVGLVSLAIWQAAALAGAAALLAFWQNALGK